MEELGKGLAGTWSELFASVFVECVCVTLEGAKHFLFLYFESKDPKWGMKLTPPPTVLPCRYLAGKISLFS